MLLASLAQYRAAGAVAAIAVLAAGYGTGIALARRTTRPVDGTDSPALRADRALREHCGRVLPVWVRQIEGVRRTADDSVAGLARSFGRVVDKLEAVLVASTSANENSGRGGGVVAAIEDGRRELKGVIAMLKAVEEAKDAMHGDVRRHAEELKAMAADFGQVALQVRLLSLNGAVEAARAGQAGKAFAVVVNEMRALSELSTKAAERMHRQVGVIESAVGADYGGELRPGDGGTASFQRAEVTIHEVVTRFREVTSSLSGSIELMERESRDIHEEIARALVDLQFQDRASQILSHLTDNMKTLERRIGEGAGAAELGDWRAEMARDFSVPEEFANLQGVRAAAARKSDITFFGEPA